MDIKILKPLTPTERLKLLLSRTYLNQKKMAELLDIHASVLSLYFTGTTVPKKTRKKIVRFFNRQLDLSLTEKEIWGE